MPDDTTSADLTELCRLLTAIDLFLRSPGQPERLTAHLADLGTPRPAFQAANLIDEISFTALYLRLTLPPDEQDPRPAERQPSPAEPTASDDHCRTPGRTTLHHSPSSSGFSSK